MRIIVVGAGKVGTALCRSLVDEKHDVILIEEKEEVLKRISKRYDVMGFAGNGANFKILEQAEVNNCDVFIAMTDKDGMAGVMIAADFLIHKLYQLLKGFFTAADFTDGSEFSVVVYMKDRFNIQHASYYCSSSGNAASAV